MLFVLLVLSACGLFGSTTTDDLPTATPTATATPVASPTPAPDVTAAPATVTLRLWVTPQFAPDSVSASGQLLQARVDAFVAAHPNVVVEVRVKRGSGQGGLLEALATATLAAPGVVPDLVLLEQNSFAQALGEQRLAPLDELVDAGWLAQDYPFALDQARSDDEQVLYGLPLFGEAIVMLHALDAYPVPPTTWDDVLTGIGPMVFPAASPQATFTLQQYLAAGGRLADESGNLLPDGDVLAQILSLYQTGNELGILHTGTLGYATNSETWQAYRENRAVLAITDTGSYLRTYTSLVNTGAARPVISSASLQNPALIRTWYLGLSGLDASRHPLAMELMAWLLEPDYLGEWGLALGYLPLQRDALEVWREIPELAFATPLLEAGQPLPPATVMAEVGPALQGAVTDVLRGRSTPADAAAGVVATLKQ